MPSWVRSTSCWDDDAVAPAKRDNDCCRAYEDSYRSFFGDVTGTDTDYEIPNYGQDE